MRIALLADVHGNLAAFEAAVGAIEASRPDAVVMAGDIINRGPRPAECLALAQSKIHHGWHILRGNHEDYVLREATPQGHRPHWESLLCAHTAWTVQRLTATQLATVATWPAEQRLAGPAGSRLHFLHASRRGNRVGIYRDMADAEMSELVDMDCEVFGVGHTHIPFVRTHRDTLIVNAGAVGMPFDRDPRVSFALLQHNGQRWEARVERVTYDRTRTDRDFHETGYLYEGGPMVPLIYHEFQHARPRLGEWHRLFEEMVRKAHITLEASVEEMLNSP